MKKILFLLPFFPLAMFSQIQLHYAEPVNTYPTNSGSLNQSIYDLNKKASDDYNSNRTEYDGTLTWLNSKRNESESSLERAALQFCYSEYKNELNKYVVGGNWQDARWDLKTASGKINANYKSFIDQKVDLIQRNNKSGFNELSKNNPNEAVKYFDKSIAVDDQNINAKYGIACALNALEKYSESIEECDKLISQNPNESAFISLRGRNYISLNKYNSAITDLEKSISISPNDLDLYYLALAKNKTLDFYGSTSDINKYIANNPTDNAYFLRAKNKSELKDYEGATNDYKKCIELNPKNSMAYNNIAWTKFLLKDYKLGLTFSNKAIEIDSTNYTAFDTRAVLKYTLGDYKGAIIDCNKALWLHSDISNCYFIRGKSKLKLQKKKEACSDLSKAGELGEIKAYEFIQKNCN